MTLNTSYFAANAMSKAQATSTSSFLASLVSSLAVAVTSIGYFAVCHAVKKLHILIYPRAFVHGTRRRLPRSLLHLLYRVTHLEGTDLLEEAGVEAFLFVRYLNFLLRLFTTSTILLGLPLLLYAISQQPSSNTSVLYRLNWASLTPQDVRIYWLYALLVPCFSTYTLSLLIWELRSSLVVRQKRQADGASRWFVAVTDIPTRLQNEARLRAQFSYAERYLENISFVAQLQACESSEKRLAILTSEIERREVAFMHNVVRSTPSDVSFTQTVRTRYLRCPHRASTPPSWLPTCVLYRGCTILHLYDLWLQEDRRRRDLNDTHLTGSAAIFTVTDRAAAMCLSLCPPLSIPNELRAVFLGASRGDIIGANLRHRATARETRRLAMESVIIVLTVACTVPVTATAALANISYLLALLPNRRQREVPVWLLGALQGIGPQVVNCIILQGFPVVLRACLGAMCFSTRSGLERSMQSFYTLFLIVQLSMISFTNGFIPTLVSIAEGSVLTIPRALADDLPLASNYYMSQILIQALGSTSTALCRLQPLLSFCFARVKTPRQRLQYVDSMLTQVYWSQTYPYYTVMATVALTYALLAPAILILTAVGLGLLVVVVKYTFLYTADIVYDTHGEHYFRAIYSTFIGLYNMQLTFIGLFLLKFDNNRAWQGVVQLCVLFVTLFATYQSHTWLKRRYEPFIRLQDDPEKIPPVELVEHRRFRVWLPHDARDLDALMKMQVVNACGASEQIFFDDR